MTAPGSDAELPPGRDRGWAVSSRGWSLVAMSVLAIASGPLFGMSNALVVGCGLLFLFVVAVLYTLAVRPKVEGARWVAPAKLHAGNVSRSDIAITNKARRRSPVLTVSDPFDGGAQTARFLLAPLPGGETAHANYQLPTERRGVFTVGPTDLSVSDPFGLFRLTAGSAPAARLVVYPRIDVVAPPPAGSGGNSLSGAEIAAAVRGNGEEFYGLRPYVRGDDLRKVHWPSSARVDDLMLREDERPMFALATIVVDTRQVMGPPAALELALSAAASLVVANARENRPQRLLTSTGYDSRAGSGAAHVEAILEALAREKPGEGDLAATVATVGRQSNGGPVIVITTSLVEGKGSGGGSRSMARTLPVVFEPSAWEKNGRGRKAAAADPAPAAAPRSGPGRPGTGPATVRVTGARNFADAWTGYAGRPVSVLSGGVR